MTSTLNTGGGGDCPPGACAEAADAVASDKKQSMVLRNRRTTLIETKIPGEALLVVVKIPVVS